MSAINQNQEIDSLSISENADGTFEINWDKEDPNWSFMNNLTSNEIQVMIQEAIQDRLNQNDTWLPQGMEHDEWTWDGDIQDFFCPWDSG